MRILAIGGSGDVGRLILPRLAGLFDLRVFDLREPPDTASLEFCRGDVTDFDAVRAAADGCDVVMYMAMGAKAGWNTTATWAASQFDVNVKGVHTSLNAAAEVGCSKAVLASSMSVFDDYLDPRQLSLPPAASDVYGLTKRLGELAAEAVAVRTGLTVNILRLVGPMADDEWMAARDSVHSHVVTAGSDVARAFEAAALRQPPSGSATYVIAGDFDHQSLDLTPARDHLGWVPLARR